MMALGTVAARVIERRNLTAVTDDFAIAVQTGGRLHVPTILEDGLPNEPVTPMKCQGQAPTLQAVAKLPEASP